MHATGPRRYAEWLYTGTGRGPTAFRYGLLGFDLVTITFFIISSFWEESVWLLAADAAIGVMLAADLGARIWIARSRRRFLLELPTLADIVVIVSLFGAALFGNFAFLRVLRALRLLRSYHVLRDLRRRSALFRRQGGSVSEHHQPGGLRVRDHRARLCAAGRPQSGDPQLHRCALFHGDDADDDGLRRRDADRQRRPAALGPDHGVRRGAVPAPGADDLPSAKGALHLPRLRAASCTIRTPCTASIAAG